MLRSIHGCSKSKQKYILINYHGDINRDLFDPNARDNCTEPFILLRDEWRKLGYLVETAIRQDLRDCACLLFWGVPSVVRSSNIKAALRRLGFASSEEPRDWLDEARRTGLINRLALILWEPPSVRYEDWESSALNEFSTIFSWNDDLVDGIHIHKFCLPIPLRVPPLEKTRFSSKKLLVNISMNKFSAYPHELYSARRDAIRYFEKTSANDFDLYGVGWDRTDTPYTSYRGMVKHKWEVLPKYKFSICYENISDQPGFITEKIFDCMRADCVPIYWGAPNVTEYVDPAAFIDRRQFKSNQELEDYIAGINEKQYEHFREAIATYLASERFKAFLSPAFVQRVVQVLGLNRSN